MNPVFIPLLVATLVLLALGILLWLGWLGSRDRRLLRKEVDREFGEIHIFKLVWTLDQPVVLDGISVKISGSGAGTSISDSQRKTVAFLRGKLKTLTGAAIAAAKDDLRKANLSDRVELAVDEVSLDEVEGSFELLLMSPNSRALLPDGVAVEFAGEKIVGVEVIH
jgi:hypothetical protein